MLYEKQIMCVGVWGRRENHMGQSFGDSGTGHLLLVLSVLFPKCLRDQKQLLLVPIL